MSSEERVIEALNFVSTVAYSIANDTNNKPKDRIDASLVFLKSEAWLARSESEPLVGDRLESLQKTIALT